MGFSRQECWSGLPIPFSRGPWFVRNVLEAFTLWCWRRLLKVPWTARGSNQLILKEINWIFIGRTDAEAEAPILWPPDGKSWLTGKDPDTEKNRRQEEKGTTEAEMVGWHHWLHGYEFEQAPGGGETGRRGMLPSMQSQTVRRDWTAEQQPREQQHSKHSSRCSVTQSCPTLDNSMDSPSPSPGICPSSCSFHSWCHPVVSSDALFCNCPQSFPASGNFPMSRMFASVSQFGRSVETDSLWPHGLQDSLPFTNSQSLLRLLSIKSVMPSNHLNLCHPHLLLPSIFPWNRVFSNESFLHIRWPKYWSFSFSISPSHEHPWFPKGNLLLDWLVWSPCSPRDSKESSPNPQFKSSNSSVLSFLYSPTLTFIHDYWKHFD